MQLQIITPEQVIFQGEIESIIAPGLDGEFQILKDHAAMVSALGKGKVLFRTTQSQAEMAETEGLKKNSDKEWRLDIDGGILELNHNKIILLAE